MEVHRRVPPLRRMFTRGLRGRDERDEDGGSQCVRGPARYVRPRVGSMVAPRRVLVALLVGAAAPAAAFQPARVSSQHRHSVAVSSTIDNRRRRRSDNEASEGWGIVNVPVTEDAIKMAKDKLDGRPGSVASAATASAVAAAAAASDALPDVGGFDPWSPFS